MRSREEDLRQQRLEQDRKEADLKEREAQLQEKEMYLIEKELEYTLNQMQFIQPEPTRRTKGMRKEKIKRLIGKSGGGRNHISTPKGQ